MSGTRIRLATPDDMPAVAAIYNESIPARMSTADLAPQPIDARRAWFANRDLATRPVTVAEDGGGVSGWGAFTNFKDRAAYAPTAEISVYEPGMTLMGWGQPTQQATPGSRWGRRRRRRGRTLDRLGHHRRRRRCGSGRHALDPNGRGLADRQTAAEWLGPGSLRTQAQRAGQQHGPHQLAVHHHVLPSFVCAPRLST